MGSTVAGWVSSGGITAVFLLMLVESCGVPFPSEVIMPAAGLAAALAGLSLPGAIVAGALGNLAGSLLAWALAARFGEPLLLGPGRWIGIRRHHLEIADRWFQRRGLLAVFVGRMLPVVRTYISFPAGLARVRIAPFAVLTFAGALPWCAGLAVAGYELTNSYDKVSGPIEKVAIVIAVLVAAGVVVWFMRGRRTAAPG